MLSGPNQWRDSHASSSPATSWSRLPRVRPLAGKPKLARLPRWPPRSTTRPLRPAGSTPPSPALKQGHYKTLFRKAGAVAGCR